MPYFSSVEYFLFIYLFNILSILRLFGSTLSQLIYISVSKAQLKINRIVPNVCHI